MWFANNTTTSNATETFPYARHDYFYFTIIFESICSFGAVSVLLLLIIIISNKTLLSGSGILVFHLQLIHLTLCGVLLPISVLWKYLSMFGQIIQVDCTAFSVLFMMVIKAENWCSLMLAINRLVAVSFPHYYKRFSSVKSISVMIVLCWLISFATNFPSYALRIISDVSAPLQDCPQAFRSSHTVQNLLTGFGTYCPLMLIGIIYASVGLKVTIHSGRKTEPTKAYPRPAAVENSKIRRKIALFRLLFCSYLWFVLCYIPTPLIIAIKPQLWLQLAPIALFANVSFACGLAFNPVRM